MGHRHGCGYIASTPDGTVTLLLVTVRSPRGRHLPILACDGRTYCTQRQGSIEAQRLLTCEPDGKESKLGKWVLPFSFFFFFSVVFLHDADFANL